MQTRSIIVAHGGGIATKMFLLCYPNGTLSVTKETPALDRHALFLIEFLAARLQTRLRTTHTHRHSTHCKDCCVFFCQKPLEGRTKRSKLQLSRALITMITLGKETKSKQNAHFWLQVLIVSPSNTRDLASILFAS